MKYYVSRTHVFIQDGKLDGYETVLTKPDTMAATKEALRRYRAIGIENLHLCQHPAKSRRWGKLDREQTKRTKTRKLTMADVAADLAELNEQAKESDNES